MRNSLIVHLMASLLALTALGAYHSMAQAESFLAPGIGLRALGMGGAFVALADDVTAAYWNPAGLSQLRGIHLVASLPFPDSSSVTVTQFYGASGTVGGFGLGGILATKTFLGAPVREEREMTQVAIGGRLTTFFRLGLAAKQYVRKLNEARTQGLGLDLGVMLEPEPAVAVGMRLTDIGGVTLRGGDPTMTTRTEMRVQLGGRARLLNDHLRFGLGMDITQGGKIEAFHVGVEGLFYEAIAARAGWDNGELRFGLGFGIKNFFDFEALMLSHGWTISTELVLFGR